MKETLDTWKEIPKCSTIKTGSSLFHFNDRDCPQCRACVEFVHLVG